MTILNNTHWRSIVLCATLLLLMSLSPTMTDPVNAEFGSSELFGSSEHRIACLNRLSCWIEGEHCGFVPLSDGWWYSCFEIVITPIEG